MKQRKKACLNIFIFVLCVIYAWILVYLMPTFFISLFGKDDYESWIFMLSLITFFISKIGCIKNLYILALFDVITLGSLSSGMAKIFSPNNSLCIAIIVGFVSLIVIYVSYWGKARRLS